MDTIIGPYTNPIFYDRVFWIYFIITLFFIIVGITLLSPGFNQESFITILWIMSNLSLMLMVYHASLTWQPHTTICIIDNNSGCFQSGNRVWLFINILFITLLIISAMWAGEFNNTTETYLKTTTGIMMLLGGLILFSLSNYNNDNIDSIIILCFTIFYLISWLFLTIYMLNI